MEELDRRILAFAGAHRFVLATHVGQFLDLEPDSVAARLAALEQQRLVRTERLQADRESLIRITGAGLRAIGSRMPVPCFAVAGYRHEVGTVWLWIAAWQGALGEPERVLSRREMEALDRAARESGVGDAGFGLQSPAGAAGDRLLYADLMLVYAQTRIAVHLVTWPYLEPDLNRVFAAHARRPPPADIVGVFVDDKGVAKAVRATAERHGIGDRLRVGAVTGEGTRRLRAAAG